MAIDLNATSRTSRVSEIALLAAFVAAYYPVFKGLVSAWQNSEDYSHGFVILPICGYLLWQKRDVLKQVKVFPSQVGLVVTVLSLAVYLFARYAEIATLASLSLIPVISGTIIYLFGFRMFKECLFPVFLLLFMIPVPSQIYASLTIPLQLFVTKISAFLASMVGVVLVYEGNIIHLPQRTLQVVQACSGLRSIMTLLTLGAVLGYLTLNSNTLRTFLFFSGVPIAIAINILRVFLMIIAIYFFSFDLSVGIAHTVFGMLIFAAALGIFFLVGRGVALWDR